MSDAKSAQLSSDKLFLEFREEEHGIETSTQRRRETFSEASAAEREILKGGSDDLSVPIILPQALGTEGTLRISR